MLTRGSQKNQRDENQMSNEPDFIDDFDFAEFADSDQISSPVEQEVKEEEPIRWSRN